MITSSKKICRRVEKEYRSFRSNLLSQGKETIWEKCHQIYFYCNILEYFRYKEHISEKYIQTLLKYSHPIDSLWEIYLSCEEESINTWEGIESLLEALSRKGGITCEYSKTGTC